MTKRMLIDASHAEETRVVVLDGNRLEDFDVETATKKQLKGNIYLAKIVRVEPSLQAAFVEYGGNRHGFLAFGEIHPDYYQIPVADRQRLLALQEEEARAEEEAEDAEDRGPERGRREERGERSRGAVTQALPIGRDLQVAPEEAAAEFPSTPQDALRPDGEADSAELALEGTEPVMAEPASTDRDAAAAFDPSVESSSAAASAHHAPAATEEDGARPDGDAPVENDAATGTGTTSPASADTAWMSGGEPSEDAVDDMPSGHAGDAPGGHWADTPDGHWADAPTGHATDVMSGSAPGGMNGGDGHAAEGGHDAEPDGPGTEADDQPAEPPPETLAGRDAGEDRGERKPSRFLRNYKIQEVIRRRQILLVQVVKEERGTKGAALTTYISMAGRFSVLMPNSPRGGGVSRKITSAADRRRLKEITQELDLPRGMGMIVRTAGAQRPKPEIKRDGEYLLRLWDDIRETTMRSTAPALIHEEASLIKRAIRDVYSRDVDEVLVDGEDGWRAARDYMRMLMPAHARKVQLWRDQAAAAGQPLFASERVEAQLDAMLSPTVQLKSGGYLVINQTEALVAVDVNSGRSTRERGIEETALRTNLEAADEVARQLRLRDLAGLIVIDFIDMEARRHNAAVEKRLKDALRDDRARIQLGSISHFGLMEMSRQRLRPSLAETSFVACPHCGGTGHVRSTENACLHVLRAIEEEGAKRRAAEIVVHVASATALYILNHKRDRVAAIEARYLMSVAFAADESLLPAQTRIDRLRAQTAALPAPLPAPPGAQANGHAPASAISWADEADDAEVEEPDVEAMPLAEADEAEDEPAEAASGESAAADAEAQRKRRRRRRRGPRREDEAGEQPPAAQDGTSMLDAPAGDDGSDAERIGEAEAAVDALPDEAAALGAPAAGEPGAGEAGAADEDEGAKRRRGRRGGRRRRREGGEEPAPDAPPAYAGPTPADPFGAPILDIFEMAELAEQREAMLSRMPEPPLPHEAVAPGPEVMPLPQSMAQESVTQESVTQGTASIDMAAERGAAFEADLHAASEPHGAGTELDGHSPAEPASHGEAETPGDAATPEPAAPEPRSDEAAVPHVEHQAEATPHAVAAPQAEAAPQADVAPPAEEAGAPPGGHDHHHPAEEATPAAASSEADHAPEPPPAATIPGEEALAAQPAVESEAVTSAPAIQPILVGTTEVPEKRRGWWRR